MRWEKFSSSRELQTGRFHSAKTFRLGGVLIGAKTFRLGGVFIEAKKFRLGGVYIEKRT